MRTILFGAELTDNHLIARIHQVGNSLQCGGGGVVAGLEVANFNIAENTVAIDYDAEQGGFLAGFGSALEVKEGEFGGLFGVETDHTKLFITGFKQGVIYANENYNTNIRLISSPEFQGAVSIVTNITSG